MTLARYSLIAMSLLCTLLIAAAPARASILDDDGSAIAADDRPSFDPFRSAVPEAKVPVTPEAATQTATPVPAPEPPPLEVGVLGFGLQGNEGIVLVAYDGGQELVERGWTSADGLVTLERMVRPSDDRVELDLLDNRTKKRFTVGYDLGGKTERKAWTSRTPRDSRMSCVRR